MRRLCILSVVALAACNSIEGPQRLPLEVAVSASATSVTAGATVEFRIQARGEGLQLLVVSFGDGVQESIILPNAIVIEENRFHIYSQPGSFLVTATVNEGGGASAQDTVRIEVAEADESP